VQQLNSYKKMAGILNNKERVIDFIMTEAGKRQAASGQMNIEFATATDYHTFYAASGSSGTGDPLGDVLIADDATKRIFFEATSRYQDTVVPELEGGTVLRGFKTADFSFGNLVIASGSSAARGFAQRVQLLSGPEITNDAGRALRGIATNFEDQRILGEVDRFSETNGFVLASVTGSFKLTDSTKMNKCQGSNSSPNIDGISSMFADGRFSHFSNFRYLPPVNTPSTGNPNGIPLGLYPELNEPSVTTWNELQEQLKSRPYFEATFSDTSAQNNIIGQFFEFSINSFEKLSVVDYGEFADDDPFRPGVRIFFVGKVKKDNDGSETFLNIFTVVFD
jgi:hypothetical protein